MKNKIRDYRARNNLTQETLANKLGVSRQTIISLERGKYNPSIKLAHKLAQIFDTTIEVLFVFNEEGTK